MTPLQMKVQADLAHLHPKFDVILAPLTYFKIGGPAEVFFDLEHREQIIEVVQYAAKQKIKLTPIGGVSNVIISSQGLKGIVLRLSNSEYVHDEYMARIGAGCLTSLAVRRTMDDKLSGLELFLGVPGRLGGAVYNNAHYQHQLIGEWVNRVEVVTRAGEVKWLSQAECHFGYDLSIFQQTHDVLLQIEFALHSGNHQESMEIIKMATLYRARTQPLGEPSSGCYFRNPANTPQLKERYPQYADRREFPAAFLIEQLGLKGAREGDIAISHKHAAFFINLGQGTSQEVLILAERVKQRVLDEYGVELKEEVFFLE